MEGKSTGSMNYSQHDELAQLFARNMQVTPQRARQDPPQQPRIDTPQQQQTQASPALHFVSSHYTQTAHLRPDTVTNPSPTPPPSYIEAHNMPDAMAEMLLQNAVDPSVLIPSQVHLFQHANDEQRQRLLELWRIFPLTYSVEEHSFAWIPTSVEQEEANARARWERKRQEDMQMLEMQGQQQQQVQRRKTGPMRVQVPPQEEHMLDTHYPEPLSPIREPGDAAWPPAARMRVASITARSRANTMQTDVAEPYIVTGYQAEKPSQATDPVYAAAAGLWQAPNYAHAVEHYQRQQQARDALQDQYGMYEQIRNHADWERMNEQMARAHFVGLHEPLDEDMVM